MGLTTAGGVPASKLKGVPAFGALRAALIDGTRSAAVQVLSDSTLNDPTDGAYRLAEALAKDWPGWTVQHRLFSDATQAYGAPVTIQTGTAGARMLDCSTGTTTRRLDASVSAHLTGSIDVRLRVSLPTWRPAVQVNFGGRSGAAGTRGWYCYLNPAGILGFAYSTDGTAVAVMAAGAAISPAVDSPVWLRWVFTPNDGAGNRVAKFYTSTDGLTWTQTGATVTTLGAVALFNPGLGFEVGGVAAGVGNAGLRVYEVEYRDGENGPSVVPALPDLWPPYNATAAQPVGAPVLTIVNASVAGATLAYHSAAGRLAKTCHDYGQLVALIGSSHNEGLGLGRSWVSQLDTFRSAVESALPGVPLIWTTQNPQTTAATWHREHAKRRLDLIGYARQKGAGLIDTAAAFTAAAGWADSLMADSVHPNAIGADLWRDTVKAALDNA